MRRRLNAQDDFDDEARGYSVVRCPSCRRTFRTLPDEQDMHACPSCGWTREAPEPEPDQEDDDTHDPHCTCNDCLTDHMNSLEDAHLDDVPTQPARLGDFEDGQ